jgi:hypothetical protein
MGTSYNTALVFGVDLGDLTDPDTYETWAPAWMLDDDGSIDDWDPSDQLARKLGWEPVPFPDHAVVTAPDRFGVPSRRMDVQHPDYIAYRASRDHRAELLKAADYGCSIDSYGHSEGDLALLVQVDASVVRGDIWRCVPVDPATLNPSLGEALGWAAKLERYLDALEIPTEHRTAPGWLLTGSVG